MKCSRHFEYQNILACAYINSKLKYDYKLNTFLPTGLFPCYSAVFDNLVAKQH